MENFAVLLFLGIIVLASANPVPDYDQDGQEILKGRDTRYWGLPAFWYRRPFTGDDGDDYDTNNGGYVRPASHRHRKHSIPVYENAGAGWGR